MLQKRNILDLLVVFLFDQLVTATLDVHKFTVFNLLPTPDHSHYLFSLKDFSRYENTMLKACCAATVDSDIFTAFEIAVFHGQMGNGRPPTPFLENFLVHFDAP